MSTNDILGSGGLSHYDPSDDSDYVLESSEGSRREDDDDKDMEMGDEAGGTDEV